MSNSTKPRKDLLLRIDSSAHESESVTRLLTTYITSQLQTSFPELALQSHDVGLNPFPPISAKQLCAVHGSFETDDPETLEQQQLSDALVDEMLNSRHLVIGAPMYNFGIPANLKVWIDHVCRARKTFRYTENGPEGLTGIDHAFIVVASGGAPIGGDWDYVSSYLTHVMNFLGVKHTHIIDAGGSKNNIAATLKNAQDQVDKVLQKLL